MKSKKTGALAALVALTLSAIANFAYAAPAHRLPASGGISLIARGEPVRDVLVKLGQLAHLSVAIADGVHGNVDLTARAANADDVLHTICAQLQLRCVKIGRTLSVSMQTSAVVPLAVMPADRAVHLARELFPGLVVRAEGAANAVMLTGADNDVQSARAVIQALDVRNATKPVTEGVTLRVQSAEALAARLRVLFPSAKVIVLSRGTLLIGAAPADLTQMKALIAGIDVPSPQPSATPIANDAVKVSQRRPDDLAHAVSRQFPHVHAAVSGSALALSGPQDDVAHAKALIALLDVSSYGAQYVQIYRIKNVDAQSVAALIQRAFPNVAVSVDATIGALSVGATAAQHQRIADGIAQIDAAEPSGAGPPNAAGGFAASRDVVQLRSILPGGQQGASTSQDFAQALQQALQGSDLRVTVMNGAQSLILSGSPQAIRAAKDLIAKLDVVPQSVVLDTEILELDESSSKNLGLQLGTTSIGTTFSEILPTPDATGNQGRIMKLQALTRTPISFQAQLSLLIQKGSARVLADPRITTLSGRTATIRAGDTISILTTVGGGTGTVATTQLQSFQTGVTLDITPLIADTGELSVALHPVVNSLTGYLNGVPQISTRDTQTTVHLHDDQTLVIGGLIQESSQRTESKIPLIGDLPVVGRAFRNSQTTNTRNELIIVVTPHVLPPDQQAAPATQPAAPSTPQPLPTVPPAAVFPIASTTVAPRPAPTAVPVVPSPPATSGTLAGSSSPAPVASAFAQANVSVYGSPPPNTYAGPADAPQIFYAMLSPMLLSANATVHVNAITTTNVQRLTIGFGATSVALAPLGQGTWQGTFSANVLGLPSSAIPVQLSLTASRGDGHTATVQLPVAVPH